MVHKAPRMRLRESDHKAIVEIFKKTFLNEDHLWLFGSRAYDEKKGGDIDLYIQTYLPGELAEKKRSRFVLDLWDAIGEQKIDVVLHLMNYDFHTPIYDIAQQEGVLLA